ncbi:MAG: hypothetical protein LBT22_07325 [Peptococcaceae bacterium]|jgi:membrane-bound ClpP family serine protease|nr:hypothetical protein [Peptococcaceae bacterium]
MDIIFLFILGLVLLIMEILLPGGILGVLGLLALIAGIFLSAESIQQGIYCTLALLLVLAVLLGLSFRFSKTRWLWQRLSLRERQSNEEGYVAPKPDYVGYIGKEGRALSLLRPAGTGEFDGERLDVVTEGGFISNGAKIQIIAVEGLRIVVREIGVKE